MKDRPTSARKNWHGTKKKAVNSNRIERYIKFTRFGILYIYSTILSYDDDMLKCTFLLDPSI